MEQRSAKEVLQKHMDAKPNLTICLSFNDKQEALIDISAPGTFGGLLFLERMLSIEINKMIEGTKR